MINKTKISFVIQRELIDGVTYISMIVYDANGEFLYSDKEIGNEGESKVPQIVTMLGRYQHFENDCVEPFVKN